MIWVKLIVVGGGILFISVALILLLAAEMTHRTRRPGKTSMDNEVSAAGFSKRS